MYGHHEAIALRAAADLRNYQYRVMRQSAAGYCNVASNPGNSVADVVGILQNKPNSGEMASVVYFGEFGVKASTTITQGVNLTSDASGQAVTAVSGDYLIGMALEAAGAAGEVVRVLLRLPAVRLTF